MRPEELVGKRAVRTQRVTYPNGHEDGSFTTSPITILKVTPTHIVYQSNMLFSQTLFLLDSLWIDENWIDYDELVNLNKTTPSESVNEQSEPPIV